MKTVPGYNLSTLTVIILVYCSIIVYIGAHGNKKGFRKKSFVAILFTRNHTVSNATNNQKDLCQWLEGLKHQRKLCTRIKGLPEILKETKNLALNSCETNFRYEQWYCTRRKKFFKTVYRETAFMHSLTTSTFMYLIAKACAAGSLENCECASHGKSGNSVKWHWGGCGDNTKFAKKLTYKFFQLRKKGDGTQNILRFNSEVGIKVVLNNEEKICKCHGLSGSCTYKICFKRIRPFTRIIQDLKNHYHSAIQVESENNICKLQKEGLREKLVYLENSLNFCPFTTGRRCKNADNCATLCCGRGFSTVVETLKHPCNCRWRNDSLYELTCQQCEVNETIHICF